MDPTPEQKKKLAEITDAFGKNVIRAHARAASNGHIRVELTAQAGIHEWSIAPDGTITQASMTMKLFEVDPAGKKPRNALDN
jgi:hypothetical protein